MYWQIHNRNMQNSMYFHPVLFQYTIEKLLLQQVLHVFSSKSGV